jgi:hypothetical protein
LRLVPDVPQNTEFVALPEDTPVDYFDPDIFNGLQPELRRRCGAPEIGLLPTVEDSFMGSADEKLSNDAFMNSALRSGLKTEKKP